MDLRDQSEACVREFPIQFEQNLRVNKVTNTLLTLHGCLVGNHSSGDTRLPLAHLADPKNQAFTPVGSELLQNPQGCVDHTRIDADVLNTI